MTRAAAIASLLPFLLAACADGRDKAAKARIFSAEDPPQAVSAALERLPPQEVAERPELARRILGMGAAEATERLGPHRYAASFDWEWTRAGRSVRLKETRELLAARGGVAGDFRAVMSNSNNAGLEVRRVSGQVYARSTWGSQGEGKFRQRQRDRGIAERIREEAAGALRDVDELFLGRVKLTAVSSSEHTASVAGRTAWKYSVSLGEPVAEAAGSAFPPVVTSKSGADGTTLRRRHFYEERVPTSLQGEVLVDLETSVVLKAHVVGRLSVPSSGLDAGAPGAELRITLDSSLTDVGRPVVIEAPRDFLRDEDKPDGVAAALARVGLGRASDGGVFTPAEAPDEAD